MRAGGQESSSGWACIGTQGDSWEGYCQCSPGKLLVVGLGPGDRNFLTPHALECIRKSHTVVGYRPYLDLIADLLPGKEVISSGMRGERERAQAALNRAEKGKITAVVSSGDPGIYGMAGIILELASPDLPVEVVPGVTAASAAASLLGAPLMLDFAVVSLSDLLVPWEKIAQRLEGAAWADYAMVLYNPRSRGRPNHLQEAKNILLRYRPGYTPVGMVRNAFRGKEEVKITTMEGLVEEEVDMLTVIVIGNLETRIVGGRMITPRGYSV